MRYRGCSPDGYRDKEKELVFLRKHKDRIPSKIKYHGKPFNLGDTG